MKSLILNNQFYVMNEPIKPKDNFFHVLRELDPTEWQVVTINLEGNLKQLPRMIRLFKGDKVCCPVTAACYQQTGSFYLSIWAQMAGREIGLLPKEIENLMAAADGDSKGEDRLRLEEAVAHLM